MFAEVIIDQEAKATDRVFEYSIPTGLNVQEGMRVRLPFGKRIVQGFIIKLKEDANFEKDKIKPIIATIDDFPCIKKEMLELMQFMAKKNHLTLASILRLFITSEMREGKVKPLYKSYYSLAENKEYVLTKTARKQQEIINYLKNRNELVSADELVNFGYSSLKSLLDKGIIIKENIKKYRQPFTISAESKKIVLNFDQKNALKEINGDETYLLHGVTGSGKTEVYMHLIERVLLENKNAIMLVPEISLTPQIMSNFKSRFGNLVALLHSGLSAGERYDEWNRLFDGEARIAIGARSAIFAPLEDLGIIIIDEEHEASYTSESNPRYNTHDIALFRARYNKCPLVLGSATPSIESYEKAKNGEYKLIELPVRVNGKEMPKIQIVDMMNEIRMGNSGIFSSQLLADLTSVINNKKQAMIFLNRRGYSSFMRCRDCGYIAKCEDCDVSLVYHKEDQRLKCHYCGKQFKVLTRCPKCGSESIKQGAVGTQQVVEKLKEYFPNVKILRMDNDTTTIKHGHLKILKQFQEQDYNVLLGTQMVAKGLDFPDVTLVGVIDSDITLAVADFRSNEFTFELLSQVAGRAGRGQKEGKVIIQTYNPDHYAIQFAAKHDYQNFFKHDMAFRHRRNYPPFSYLNALTLLCEKPENALLIADQIADYLKTNTDFELLGPSFPYIYKENLKYKVRILMKSKNQELMIQVLHQIVEQFKKELTSKKCSLLIDINTYKLL